jgi:hypothetical protein
MIFTAPACATTSVGELKPIKATVDREPHFVDQCVGGSAHELVAQANILTARQHPDYGLPETLAVTCPRFVWQVLRTNTLDAPAKKKAFADVLTWTAAQRQNFYIPLQREAEAALDTAWKNGFRN